MNQSLDRKIQEINLKLEFLAEKEQTFLSLPFRDLTGISYFILRRMGLEPTIYYNPLAGWCQFKLHDKEIVFDLGATPDSKRGAFIEPLNAKHHAFYTKYHTLVFDSILDYANFVQHSIVMDVSDWDDLTKTDPHISRIFT